MLHESLDLCTCYTVQISNVFRSKYCIKAHSKKGVDHVKITYRIHTNTQINELMTFYHDEVEIEDFEYDEDEDVYYYPCPCGDQFQITKADLIAGEEEATCPSCSLVIKVIYDKEAFAAKQEELSTVKEKELIAQKA